MENKQAIVMYHNHCTDGFGAAYAAWLVLGDNAKYIPMSYGYIEKGVTKNYLEVEAIKDKTVYILDFSVPIDYYEYLVNHARRLIWLDHHEDSFNLLGIDKTEVFIESERDRHTTLDTNKSGAMLAWEHFHGEPAIALIQWIDDRDRWQFKFHESKAFHAGLEAMKPWNFKQWLSMQPYDVVAKGEALLEMKEVHYDAVIGAATREITMPMVVDGNIVMVKGLAANAPPFYASEIGNKLAKKSGTFGMTWYMTKEGHLGVSFRSLDGFSAKALANVQGGGGHGNAAGCKMSMTKLLSYME